MQLFCVFAEDCKYRYVCLVTRDLLLILQMLLGFLKVLLFKENSRCVPWITEGVCYREPPQIHPYPLFLICVCQFTHTCYSNHLLSGRDTFFVRIWKLPSCWVQLLASGAICQSGLNLTETYLHFPMTLCILLLPLTCLSFSNREVPACPSVVKSYSFPYSPWVVTTPFLLVPTADLAHSPVGISVWRLQASAAPSLPLWAPPCRCYPCPYPVPESDTGRGSQGFCAFGFLRVQFFQDLPSPRIRLSLLHSKWLRLLGFPKKTQFFFPYPNRSSKSVEQQQKPWLGQLTMLASG